MYKFDKYLHKFNKKSNIIKKNKYMRKIAEKIGEKIDKNNSLIGGGDGDGIIDGNLESLFDYIKSNMQNNHVNTKNKYIVILYGPPSSGKNLARKIACNKIKMIFDEQFEEESIYDSFIDSGVDEIIYSFKKNADDTKVIDKLQDKFNENIEKFNNSQSIKETVKKNISKFAFDSYNIYSQNKSKSDAISELIKFLSVFLNLNIFIETASWYGEYWNKFLGIMSYYNYIPIVIYPFTENSQLLFDRSIDRGIKEYRFLQHDTDFGIMKMADNAKNNFKDVIKNIRDIYVENSYFFVYDTNIDITTYDEINNFIFTSAINEIYTLKTIKTGDISFIRKEIKKIDFWDI